MARVKGLALLEQICRKKGHLLGNQAGVFASQWHSTASKESATGTMQWFPPSLSSAFRDLMSSGAAQQPATVRAAEASSLAVETPTTTASPAPLEESAADSPDLIRLLETVRGPAPNSYESSRTICSILERVALTLDTLSPAHTTVLVSALGQLEKRDAIVDIVLEAVSEAVQDRVREFSAPQLASICGSYVGLGQRGYGYSALLDAIVGQVLRSFKDLDAAGLVKLAAALSTAEHHSEGSDQLLKAIAAGALDLVPTFAPAQLVSLAASFGALRFAHGPLYAAVARQARPGVAALQPRQRADLLLAYALLGHREPELVDALTAALMADPGGLTASAQCDVLWALAVLGTLTREIFACLAAQLERQPLDAFGPEDFQQLYQAQLLAQACPWWQQGAGGLRLAPWLQQYASRTWQDRVDTERSYTRLQQRLCRALAEMGVAYDERFLHDMRSAIVLHGPHKIAILPEGPTSYSSSWPKMPLGETLAVRRLLAVHGWTVVPVAKHEYAALAPAKRQAYLSRLIADARASAAAAAGRHAHTAAA